MNFREEYTTNEKIAIEEKDEKIKEKIEKGKTVLSNDAYALGSMVEKLLNKIEHARVSLIK